MPDIRVPAKIVKQYRGIHKRFKILCLQRDIDMQVKVMELIREWVEKEESLDRGEGEK